MKFQVYRTSQFFSKDIPPIEEAYEGTIEILDRRTVNDPNKLHTKENWYGIGWDHTTYTYIDNNKKHTGIQRILRKEKCYYVDVNSIEELTKLTNKYGDIIVGTSFNDCKTPCLEIYDDYRE